MLPTSSTSNFELMLIKRENLMEFPSDLSYTNKCRVCTAQGAQMFYGGFVCPSCRVFFIRAVNRIKPYHCPRGGHCRITEGNKNNCKACRFAQCQKADMIAESVGRRRKEKGSGCPSDSVVPYFAPVTVNLRKSNLAEHLSVGYKFVTQFTKIESAKHFAESLIHLEGICDNIHGPKPSTMFSNLDASLAEVLKYSQACSERTSIGWNLAVQTVDMTDYLHLVYCRCATLIADFISAAPEIHELEEKDKLRLVNYNFCDLGLITMLYNTWIKGYKSGLIFPHGYKFAPDEDSTDEMNSFLRQLVVYLHKNVVSIFERISLTAHEYTLLKMIILFGGAAILSDRGGEITAKAKTKYTRILTDFVNDAYQTWPEMKRMQRIADLFLILEKLKIGSVYDNQYCAKLVMLNIGRMKGNLPYDIHVRCF